MSTIFDVVIVIISLLYFTLVVHVYKYLCLSVIKQMKRMKEETITSATETETAITLTCRHMSESHFRCSEKELKLTLWDVCLCVCINKTLPPPRPPSPISIEICRKKCLCFYHPACVILFTFLSTHFFIPLASPKFAMSHRISTIRRFICSIFVWLEFCPLRKLLLLFNLFADWQWKFFFILRAMEIAYTVAVMGHLKTLSQENKIKRNEE